MASATMRPTTVLFDESLKLEATSILDSIGLGLNSCLTLALRQLVNQRKIPFELVSAAEVPSEETRMATLRAEAKMYGLLPDDDPRFDDVGDFMAHLEAQ